MKIIIILGGKARSNKTFLLADTVDFMCSAHVCVEKQPREIKNV